MDHTATMRNTYELISAGDLAGFGDLVADDFVDHDGGAGFPAHQGGDARILPGPARRLP
ncbi:hypothetical protein [Nocardioides euryhalodurans]|uniref:hypothetical protein n=1 Tax=Nocardioides euryhalodurans TaxID=2518370 RepID=UPI001421FA4B|nr:hypothetical protein [Nocardioides euryhalodurans]